MRRTSTIALLMLCSISTHAAPREVTLALPTMDCPVCPITIKKALVKIAGVSQVQVSFEQREAVVSFDDAKTSTAALMRATHEAGYPSTVKDGGR